MIGLCPLFFHGSHFLIDWDCPAGNPAVFVVEPVSLIVTQDGLALGHRGRVDCPSRLGGIPVGDG